MASNVSKKRPTWPAGSAAIKNLRERKGVTQKELLEQLRAHGIFYSDERYIREFEAGQRRPPRLTLTTMLVRCFELEDIRQIDEVLECFEYAPLSSKEI